MSDVISYHHFVRHADIPAFEAAGWILEPTDLGPTHGLWSVLMTWPHEGEPPTVEIGPAPPLLILEAAE